jgi:hypothetical protein
MSQQPQRPRKKNSAKPSSQPSRSSKSSGGANAAPTSKGRAPSARALSISGKFDGYGVSASGSLNYKAAARSGINNNNTPENGPISIKEEPIGTLTSPAVNATAIVVAHTFQPGMEAMFPWLSTAASGYQRYRVRKAGYKFVPFVGVYSDGGRQGKVCLYFAYEVNAPLPTDMATAENSKPSLCNQVTEWKSNNTLWLDPAYMQDTRTRSKLVRTNDQYDSLTLRDFDAGKLIVAMADFATSTPIGTLYAVYEVELLVPQPKPATSAPEVSRVLDYFYIAFTGPEAVAQLTGVTVGSTTNKWTANASNAGNVTVSTGGIFTLERGFYLLTLTVQVGDPTNAGNAIVQSRFYLTYNPGTQQTPIYGFAVSNAGFRGHCDSVTTAIPSTSASQSSLYLSQYSLSGETIVGANGYNAYMTFTTLT